MQIERSTLSSYTTGLLANGRSVFSADEAQREIGISRGAFLDAAERMQRRGQLIRPRRGFYVVVPPQHAVMGAPPPEWFRRIPSDLSRVNSSTRPCACVGVRMSWLASCRTRSSRWTSSPSITARRRHRRNGSVRGSRFRPQNGRFARRDGRAPFLPRIWASAGSG